MAADASYAQLRQITDSLQRYVEVLKEGGVDGLPQAQHVSKPETHGPPSPSQPIQAEGSAKDGVSVQHAHTDIDRQQLDSLPALREAIGDCQRCKLCEHRTQIVFGVGDPHAELVFVGEGPGYDEDLKGEPFVGRAGQLLTEIITKGMKMRREEVYIANVVKCRPPNNRDPEADEIAACEPFLRKQIELIEPRIIIALGAFAARTLLQTKTPISQLRGVWHTYQGTKLMPTLHPAYLLRTPRAKRLVWQDIKAVLREIGRL